MKIVAIYSLASGLWIFLSDSFLALVFSDPIIISRLSMYKGFLFVILTATLLYFLISRYIKRISAQITEIHRAQQKMAYQKMLLDVVIEGTTDAIYVKDIAGRYLLANSAVAHFVKKPLEEIIGQDDRSLFSADDARSLMQKDQWVMTQLTPQTFEEYLTTPEGQKFFSSTKGPVRNSSGEVIGLFGIARDTSKIKQAEDEKNKLEIQLLQAQKMESVGRLAGGIAHDFNNMLGVILGHAELALMHSEPVSRITSDLKEICKAAERSADLTRQLLAFARKQTIVPKVLDLNETLTGMFKMLQRLIGEDIQLTWQPAAHLWPIRMDSSQLDQIMANLCVNARDAIVDIGKISIETKNCSIDAVYCLEHADAVPGDYVQLSVSDTGRGMDKATLAKIFEPFFTTKERGQGTGLGLATIYGAVKQNNGFIHVYSEPDSGSTFSIYLPRYAGATAQEAGENVQIPAPQGGRETVLVVEDEPDILDMTTIILERLGYSVLAAHSPGEALTMAHEHGDAVDLLITDVIMPEMNGKDLSDRVKECCSHIECLYMSGYTADIISHHGVLDEGVHFIQKPFTIGTIASSIRKVLDK
ncbi:MAG TPA: PAS domain-containing protein [Desulfuromonadales bacterium]|nr:PAS domain-containing protein [Desulfuromonadales bacterium]